MSVSPQPQTEEQQQQIWSLPSLLFPPNPAFVPVIVGSDGKTVVGTYNSKKGGILINALRPTLPTPPTSPSPLSTPSTSTTSLLPTTNLSTPSGSITNSSSKESEKDKESKDSSKRTSLGMGIKIPSISLSTLNPLSPDSPTSPPPSIHPTSVISQLQSVKLSPNPSSSKLKTPPPTIIERKGSVIKKTSIRFAPLPNPRRDRAFSEVGSSRDHISSALSESSDLSSPGENLERVRSAPPSLSGHGDRSGESPNSSRGTSPNRRSGNVDFARKWIKPLLGIKKKEGDFDSVLIDLSNNNNNLDYDRGRRSPSVSSIGRSKYPPVAQRGNRSRSSRGMKELRDQSEKNFGIDFVEWDFAGTKTGKALSDSKVSKASSKKKVNNNEKSSLGGPISRSEGGDEDEDDGGGMAWVRKRKREREEKERKQKEIEEAEKKEKEEEIKVETDGPISQSMSIDQSSGSGLTITADSHQEELVLLEKVSNVEVVVDKGDSESIVSNLTTPTIRQSSICTVKKVEKLSDLTNHPSSSNRVETSNSNSNSGESVLETSSSEEDDEGVFEERSEEDDEEEEDDSSEEGVGVGSKIAEAAGREVWHRHKVDGVDVGNEMS